MQPQIKENEHLLKVAEYNLAVANAQLQPRARGHLQGARRRSGRRPVPGEQLDELVAQLNLMERLGDSDVDTVRSIAAYPRDIKDRRIKLEADKESAAKLVATPRRTRTR